jgi:hypothetical protein
MFVLAQWVLFSSTGFLLSIPRFTLVLFPIMIWLAGCSARRYYLSPFGCLVAFLLLFTIYLRRYLQGGWGV